MLVVNIKYYLSLLDPDFITKNFNINYHQTSPSLQGEGEDPGLPGSGGEG